MAAGLGGGGHKGNSGLMLVVVQDGRSSNVEDERAACAVKW